MSTPLHPHQLRAGEMVRDFRVVRWLGAGGFSFVFLVERGGHRYFMKVAARPVSEKDADRVDDWLRREVTALDLLKHTHLLPVLEWGRWPEVETGYGYFVTPYVRGSTFHVWRWRERASLHQSVGLVCEYLEALQTLHVRGVCHRDIKADNLLVRQEDDKPVLIDFGAVHLPWARALTEGVAPGTLYCQPPEAVVFLVSEAFQPGSRLEARPAADLYAVGLLLYETLTNCRPFSTRLTLEQLLIAIGTAMPPDPRTFDPELPAGLCTLVMRLLAKAPADRPPSAWAVREELLRMRDEEGHTAVWQAPVRLPSECPWAGEVPAGMELLEEGMEEPPAPEEPSAPEPPPAPAGPASGGGPPSGGARWTGRRRVLVIVALLVGLLGIGWMLLRGVHPAPAPSEKGTHSVPSAPPSETSSDSSPAWASSRVCRMLTGLLGLSAAQLAGCATVPARPDPIGYLARCSPEARATPVRLGIEPYEQPSFLETGTPASRRTIEDGGALNLKPGPVTAIMLAFVNGKEVEFKISGEAVTLPHRVYIQFDRIYPPEGEPLPICGVAVDDIHQYGIPTYAKLPIPGNAEGDEVDPEKVDKSPGSVVLNDPRFETVLQGPEGYYVPRINFAPPGWR
ncbi:MAG TPA: serine/threonine-protein kinase [Archangium sp.]|nr:serine/threonine-protein kinase [Archangium sp.]